MKVMTMRYLLSLLIAVLGFGALIAPTSAQDTQSATVRIDGRSVFQVGPSMDGEDPNERAGRIEDRLSPVLRNLDSMPPAIARPVGLNWVISVAARDVTVRNQ